MSRERASSENREHGSERRIQARAGRESHRLGAGAHAPRQGAHVQRVESHGNVGDGGGIGQRSPTQFDRQPLIARTIGVVLIATGGASFVLGFFSYRKALQKLAGRGGARHVNLGDRHPHLRPDVQRGARATAHFSGVGCPPEVPSYRSPDRCSWASYCRARRPRPAGGRNSSSNSPPIPKARTRIASVLNSTRWTFYTPRLTPPPIDVSEVRGDLPATSYRSNSGT